MESEQTKEVSEDHLWVSVMVADDPPAMNLHR